MNKTALPHRHLRDLMTPFLEGVRRVYTLKPIEVIQGWCSVTEKSWGHATEAIAFRDGVLWVKVAHAPLYQILVQYERVRLLQQLQHRFPSSGLRELKFLIG